MFLLRFINRLALLARLVLLAIVHCLTFVCLFCFVLFFWCCDPRCLADVEVCRGEKARMSTTSCKVPSPKV